MTKGQLIFAILALVLVMTAFPVVSAFEGAKVNVSASETIPATKTARLATAEEIDLILGAGYPDNPAGITWDYVPAQTPIVWVVGIQLMNPLDYTMTGVSVTDQFNEHVGIALLSYSQGSVAITPPNQLTAWNGFNLAPGASACLELLVWTLDEGELEPYQQFAEVGTYNLNYSGIIMTWYDPAVTPQSYLNGGPSLTVTVYEPQP